MGRHARPDDDEPMPTGEEFLKRYSTPSLISPAEPEFVWWRWLIVLGLVAGFTLAVWWVIEMISGALVMVG